MKLFLITHAHTQIQPEQEANQWVLSATGQQQAVTLATLPMWESVEQIVLSSEAKTRLTVDRVLTQRKLPVLVDARFDELYRPGWVEDYPSQVRRAFAEPTQAAGEWEAAADALGRFQAGIADLCQHFAGARLALVGHGLTLSLYRTFLLGQSHVQFAHWQQLSFAAVALADPLTPALLQDFEPVAGQMARTG